LSSDRQAVQELTTTQQGFRLATSVGGVLTGRGANYIILDDPQKPDEALSDTQRKNANDWFDHTLYSRLNDKKTGCIILIMQRLHEDDLVGHVLSMKEPWSLIRFPAIAEEDETHLVQTPYGTRRFARRAGEALHAGREPLELLNRIRETVGEYNFAAQYQQTPSPLGGGLVKGEWFRTYTNDLPSKFEMVFQSWDTANKPSELSDYSAGTTWGGERQTPLSPECLSQTCWLSGFKTRCQGASGVIPTANDLDRGQGIRHTIDPRPRQRRSAPNQEVHTDHGQNHEDELNHQHD
jgi:hypothetical protein